MANMYWTPTVRQAQLQALVARAVSGADEPTLSDLSLGGRHKAAD